MKNLLALSALFCASAEFARSDPNIYGPGGINLGPNGNLYRYLQQLEPEPIEKDETDDGLTLRQQNSGHYSVEGAVNGIPLVFVIDTGASVVTLPQKIALKAGIECENEAIIETANGRTEACTGRIARLKFGDFSVADIGCVIAPNLNIALLGNNALKRFEMLQHDGEIRITRKK